jgi:hypothetical protein
MKKTVLRYGLGSAAILGGLSAILLTLTASGRLDFDDSELFGYSTMVLAFLLVFFGIRSYRDEVGGGVIGFGKALQVGLLISLIACAAYVVAWQIIFWGFFPDFLDRYQVHAVAEAQAAGKSAPAIAEMRTDMAKFAELYKNPLFNVAITFLEVFPIGLIVALVSAAILRRKSPPPLAAGA